MTVNNVNALLNYTSPQTAAADQTAFQQDEFTRDSFGQVMTKVNDAVRNLQTQAAGAVSSTVQQAADAVKGSDAKAEQPQAAETQQAQQNVKDDTDRAQDTARQDDRTVGKTDGDTQNRDEAVEEVEKSAKELVQKTADELDVSPEEVEEAMAALGLVPADLFDAANLKQLVLTIAGETDDLSLLTDEPLFTDMKNLLGEMRQSLEDLQQQLGLDDGELQELIGQAVAQEKAVPAQEAEAPDLQTQPEQPADMAWQPETAEKPLEGMKDYTVTVVRDGETVQMKVAVDDRSGDKSVQEQVTQKQGEQIQPEERPTKERHPSEDGGRGESHANADAFLQNLNRPQQTVETPAPVNAGYQSAQTQEIMDQILDYMKISLKPDNVQELHLQLHPASLGTVHIQIAAKDGVITAQFATQNETVRAAVETQLIQLKEQFEEQGIKVDAVEVTVAGHEYGQQFSQENREDSRNQGRTSKATRRINLDDMDEEADIEQMEDSERITVEMMQANGNTVDFTA